MLAFAAGACGPKASKDSYQKAVSKQEACCNGLGDGAARQECLDRIVRVDDPAVQTSDVNRATYHCVERHFVCDGGSGAATQESAQAQLDCISDLGG